MGIFDFLKGAFSENEHVDQEGYKSFFDNITAEAKAKSKNHAFNAYTSLESFQNLVQKDDDFVKGVLLYSFKGVLHSWNAYKKGGSYYSKDSPWGHGLKLIPLLLKKVHLEDSELLVCAKGIKAFRKAEINSYVIPSGSVLDALEQSVRQKALNAVLEEALSNLVSQREYGYAEEKKQNERIAFLLQGEPNDEVNKHDEWGRDVIAFLNELPKETRTFWTTLFGICKQASHKSEPSKKWIRDAAPLVDKIGRGTYASQMKRWLEMLKGMLQEIHKLKGRFDFVRDENHDILKGLIWCAGFVNDTELNRALDDYAAWAYKKKPGLGPISSKTGTAAMCAFSMMPLKEGVPRLSKFRMKIKNNTILKSIDRCMRAVSEANQIGVDEIEELAVPDFSIHEGKMVVPFGEYLAHYEVSERNLYWEKDGKLIKTIPAEVKSRFSHELKDLKARIKEIETLLPVISNRLEAGYLRHRTWKFSDWYELYVNHPLTSLVSRKLIWHFFKGEQKVQAMFMEERFLNSNGEEITWLNDDAQVQLWHPIGFSSEDILRWRTFLGRHQIVQPFKQAYREVYIITDAELRTQVYSNRFAAHILRQHQFAALCRQRGWRYHLMGNWDSHNTPVLQLPRANLVAMFFVEAGGHDANTNEMGIFTYIATDQVRFSRGGNEPLPLHDVPALEFSEVMRDVDLFVGVTSIGNDPAWHDSGVDPFMNTYWREYSFSELSESAKIRGEVLQALIPKLKIAPRCSFNKKFLVVEGKVRTYKIHMGSGNILMEPDDQYLCIVPDARTRPAEKVFLPFEGDNLLSIIISKALLLADDDKIKDQTILQQIHR